MLAPEFHLSMYSYVTIVPFVLRKYLLYSGVGAKIVPHNIVLRTIIVHSSCGVDAVKRELLRTEFLEL